MPIELPFRENVSIILVNKDNDILVGERFSQTGTWQFPQGGVEDQDSLEETVYREIEEELGLPRQAVKIIRKLQATNRYTWQDPPRHFVGKFQGQDQTFWLVELCDPEAEFNLSQEHQEFQRIQWVNVDEVLQIVEPTRVPGYTCAIDEIKKYLKER